MARNKKPLSIAVDFDGTLAEYDHWRGVAHLGKPIPEMVRKVHQVLAAGGEVTIFTARVNPGHGTWEDALSATRSYVLIAEWCQRHLGVLLPITHEKSRDWEEMWDDRAKQVIPNMGVFLDELMEAADAQRGIQPPATA